MTAAHEGQKSWKLNVYVQPCHSERGAPVTGTKWSWGGVGDIN